MIARYESFEVHFSKWRFTTDGDGDCSAGGSVTQLSRWRRPRQLRLRTAIWRTMLLDAAGGDALWTDGEEGRNRNPFPPSESLCLLHLAPPPPSLCVLDSRFLPSFLLQADLSPSSASAPEGGGRIAIAATVHVVMQ